MANTFLNNRTGIVASNNPQANVNQVQSNQTGLGTSTNVPNLQNQMNPITIPIQIQPQLASQPQVANTVNQPQNNLGNNQQLNNAPTPTPQPYQANNQNTNAVDFNQIYSAYQNQYGNTYNSNSIPNSGVKRTSIGTTIVTPKTTNINSIQGQYQSAYSDTINGVISNLLMETQSMKNGFNYDPSQDMALRVASEYAANSTLQSLAGSGVLNSSSTSERVARIVSELIPQYEKLAYDRQVQYLNQLANTANIVMDYDTQQFQYWKDAKDREFKEREFEFEKQQKELENAWKRIDELGYADNTSSAILGIKVGTLSRSAREAIEQRQYELNKMREQYQLEHENNVAIAKLKNELELQSSKALADYNANIEKSLYSYKSNVDTSASKELARYKSELETASSKELASYQNSLNRSNKEYEYQLAQKYGTSNSKTSTSNDYTSYSTHDEIIKNRWGIEDIATGQITINDEKTNNNDEVYNYLANAYASGRISQKDFAALIAKYGITVPSQKGSNTTVNSSRESNPFGHGGSGGFR